MSPCHISTFVLTLILLFRCYPKLNEGDQVVLINGRDVSTHTHDQVVNFIRASSEPHSGQLILAVKQVMDISVALLPTLGIYIKHLTRKHIAQPALQVVTVLHASGNAFPELRSQCLSKGGAFLVDSLARQNQNKP